MNRAEYNILKHNFESMLKKEQTEEDKAFNEGISLVLSLIKDVFNKNQEDEFMLYKEIDDSTFLVSKQKVCVSNSCNNNSESIYVCKWLMYTFHIRYISKGVKLLDKDDFKFIPDNVIRATMSFIFNREMKRGGNITK